jgi:hypothetical protein
MISAKFAFLAACSLAAPAVVQAQQPAPATPADAVAPHPDAVRIAEIILPLDQVLAAGMATGKRAFFEMFRSNPEVAELERSFPGIAAMFWPEMEPELRRVTIEEHPDYLNMVAGFYSSRFTPAELAALRTLYATPTGKKIIGAMYRDAGSNAMVDEIVRDPTAPVSQAAANETVRARTSRALETLTKEDEAPIMAALRVVPAAKLERANADLLQLGVQWLNRPRPELDARLQAIMDKAMQRYVEDHPPKE